MLFVMSIAIILSCCTGVVYALDSDLNIDNTNVLEDLQNSDTFNLLNYPKNAYGDIQIITFAEYCYSYYENGNSNYGLYVYVYNPALLNFSEVSAQNKIQIATSFDNEGNANDYTKFSLAYVNKSLGDNSKLFYKFKVIDPNNIILSAVKNYAKKHIGVRRYAISGVELLTVDAILPIDYTIATTYDYSGFAVGYGNSDDFPLTLNISEIETIQLDVKHTFYRTETSSKGVGYQNQLNTVYFAVPNEFLTKYGKLQRIKAEWYEYKSKDIVVTENYEAFNAIMPYLGTYFGHNYNGEVGYSLGENVGSGSDVKLASWGWNLGSYYLHPACDMLTYLFLSNDIESYDPYADIISTGGIDSNTLYNYILNYNKSYVNGYVPIKDDLISADLFTSDIDDYRKKDTSFGKIQQGYSYYDFDADTDLLNMLSWNDTDPSFWDNWVNYGLWSAIFGNIPNETGNYNLPPIYALKPEDLNGTKESISDRLLINANDVTALRDYANSNNDSTVFLFRFATTDYYASDISLVGIGKGFLGSDKITNGQAYRAWQSVFLNFDVIQLTFAKDSINTVIPVVSNPIDIINPITPPVDFPESFDWLKLILGILALILLIVVIAPILPLILQLVIWLITLPFRLIGGLFKLKKKYKNKSVRR